MTNDKFELLPTELNTSEGKPLFRIKALKNIGNLVRTGDLGGYVEKESNLDTLGNAWVSGNAQVSGDAWVYGKEDFLVIGPALSSGRYTTAYKDNKLGVGIVCGCFEGSLEDFKKSIEETHKDKPQALRQYRLFHQFIKDNFQDTLV